MAQPSCDNTQSPSFKCCFIGMGIQKGKHGWSHVSIAQMMSAEPSRCQRARESPECVDRLPVDSQNLLTNKNTDPEETEPTNNKKTFHIKETLAGAGTEKVSQGLRALAAFAEDRGSVPSTHMVLCYLWL